MYQQLGQEYSNKSSVVNCYMISVYVHEFFDLLDPYVLHN